jgi:N-acetylmuramoyl-L-alanine amidase
MEEVLVLRRVFCILLVISLMLFTSIGFAEPAPKMADKPGARLLAVIKTASAKPEAVSLELTQFRWAAHTDAVTGLKKLRLVFDASGPVEAQGVVDSAPTPRLIINVKGATPGKIESAADLDGKIAESLSISASEGQNTKIVVEMPLMMDESEYKVFTLPMDPANNKPHRVVVDINQPFPPMDFKFTAGLKNKVIAIDPGHGGSDPGAVGLAKAQEKTVNLEVALKVKSLLEKAGAKVLMTRQDDRDVYGPNASAVDELKARTTVANLKKADIFLSIHSNAAVNRAADGTSTYYYQKTAYDALLARNLQAGMVQAGGLKDRGSFPANFYVVKRTIMPAALVELAFLSNPAEEKLLLNPQFQQKMAQGIVQGLENFFIQAAKMGGEQ